MTLKGHVSLLYNFLIYKFGMIFLNKKYEGACLSHDPNFKKLTV